MFHDVQIRPFLLIYLSRFISSNFQKGRNKYLIPLVLLMDNTLITAAFKVNNDNNPYATFLELSVCWN